MSNSENSSVNSNTIRRELTQRLQVRGSLLTWSKVALAPHRQEPAAHHRLLIRELESVTEGRTDRLMIQLPPGSAKSTYASLLFPPWWFIRHPTSCIIAASHTASLARHFGHGVRGLIDEHSARLGYGIDTGLRSAMNLRTTAGGQYFAAGVRGSVTGRRADLVLLDDPIRSYTDAESPNARDALWDWFRTDLITRIKPQGRVVIIMTRWHHDDLCGRLLAGSDAWRVLRLPALAENDDPLGRQPGEALWPGWEGSEALGRKRDALGERRFAALFQQAPMAQAGNFFEISRIDIVQEVDDGKSVRAWDLAATKPIGGRDPDWTVGVRMTRETGGRFILADVIRFRSSPAEVEAAIRETARHDGPEVAIGLPQDPGQAGRAQVAYLVSRLAGHRVIASPEVGAKTTRALPLASQIAGGNFAIRHASWNRALLDEMADFPSGAKDDQVDAASRAFSMLSDVAPAARFSSLNILGR